MSSIRRRLAAVAARLRPSVDETNLAVTDGVQSMGVALAAKLAGEAHTPTSGDLRPELAALEAEVQTIDAGLVARATELRAFRAPPDPAGALLASRVRAELAQIEESLAEALPENGA